MQTIPSMSAADPLILYTSIINKALEFNKAVSVPIQRKAHFFRIPWLRHTDTPTCWTYELLWIIMWHCFHTGCSVVKLVTEEAGLHFSQYSWPYWLAYTSWRWDGILRAVGEAEILEIFCAICSIFFHFLVGTWVLASYMLAYFRKPRWASYNRTWDRPSSASFFSFFSEKKSQEQKMKLFLLSCQNCTTMPRASWSKRLPENKLDKLQHGHNCSPWHFCLTSSSLNSPSQLALSRPANDSWRHL